MRYLVGWMLVMCLATFIAIQVANTAAEKTAALFDRVTITIEEAFEEAGLR